MESVLESHTVNPFARVRRNSISIVPESRYLETLPGVAEKETYCDIRDAQAAAAALDARCDREHARLAAVARREMATAICARKRTNAKTVEDEVWKACHHAAVGDLGALADLLSRRAAAVVDERDADSSWPPLHFAAKGGPFFTSNSPNSPRHAA